MPLSSAQKAQLLADAGSLQSLINGLTADASAPSPAPAPTPAPAPAPGVPAWRANMAINEWRELAGSAMSNFPPTVDPGRSSDGVHAKMDTWCGLSIDTRTSEVWSPANGGHDNYHGNEVDKFDLRADAPGWVEVLRSNTAAEFTIPSSAPRYSSGRPASIHSYYSQQFIERHNRAVRVGTPSPATTATPHFWAMEAFDATVAAGVNGWDAAGTYPAVDSGQGPTPDWAVTKNPLTEDLFLMYANNWVKKLTPSASGPGGTWAQVSTEPPPMSAYDSASAYDTTRNRIFYFARNVSWGTGICHTFDPATGHFTARTLSGEPATLAASKGGLGMVYVPQLDAYLVRLGTAGGSVYKIDASTFAVTVFGSAPIPAADTSVGPYENVYTRWLLVPAFTGAIYFPRYNANAWFLRLY